MEPQKNQIGRQEKGNGEKEGDKSKNRGRQKSKEGNEEKAHARPVESRKKPGETGKCQENITLSSWETN